MFRPSTFNSIHLQRKLSAQLADRVESVFQPCSANLPSLRPSKTKVTPAEIGRRWIKIAKDPDTAILGETPTKKEFRPILDKLPGPDAQNVEIREEKLPSGEPSGMWNFRERATEQHRSGYVQP